MPAPPPEGILPIARRGAWLRPGVEENNKRLRSQWAAPDSPRPVEEKLQCWGGQSRSLADTRSQEGKLRARGRAQA